MNRLALYLSCVAVLSACDDKKADTKPAVAPVAATDKPAVAAPKGTGIADPGNDPKIVELAKKALACKWADGKFDSECADLKAWNDETAAFADGKGGATLIAFMEDSDEKVRNLALKRLWDWDKPLTDKALAERVIALAEKTKAFNEMYPLGNVTSRIQLGDSGLFPRIKTLLTDAGRPAVMRNPIALYLLRTNPENQEVFTLIRETIKDQNNEVNRNALQAFAGIEVNDKTKEARCDVFTESIDHANDDLSGEAAEYLSQPKFGCTARYDALLKSLDARMKAKKFTSPMAATALRLLCSEKAGSPAQMKTANGIARKLAEDKTVKSSVRADAIAASVTCDPKGAKALLGKFKKDADPAVKEEVARIERVAKNKKK